MKHPYADILIAIAEGKEIQARQSCGWINVNATSVFAAILCPLDQRPLQPSDYRIKPATITINGVECEAPRQDGAYHISIKSHGFPEPTLETFSWDSTKARDAAYAALILPFGEAK